MRPRAPDAEEESEDAEEPADVSDVPEKLPTPLGAFGSLEQPEQKNLVFHNRDSVGRSDDTAFGRCHAHHARWKDRVDGDQRHRAAARGFHGDRLHGQAHHSPD